MANGSRLAAPRLFTTPSTPGVARSTASLMCKVDSSEYLTRFQKTIDVDFIFEINQEIRFVMYDIDDILSTKFNVEIRAFNPHDHDLLGYLHTTLGDIVGSRNCQMTSALTGKRGKKEKLYGTITILAEEISYGVVSRGLACI